MSDTGDRRCSYEMVAALVAELGIRANRDQVAEILETGVAMAADRTDRLDLKITASAMGEMRDAFLMFAPYRDHPKVTIFGSARTRSADPTYRQTHDVAAAFDNNCSCSIAQTVATRMYEKCFCLLAIHLHMCMSGHTCMCVSHAILCTTL